MTKRRKPNLSERRQLSPKKSERNAQVALLHVDGLPNYQVAEKLKIGVNTVASILKPDFDTSRYIFPDARRSSLLNGKA